MDTMDQFIAGANIKRYKQMAAETLDAARKAMLLRLVAVEEEHLRDLGHDPD